MPFPTQFTAIASTTNQTADSGIVDMGAIANQWSVQVVHSGQIGRPTFNFTASTDGVNFSKVDLPPNVTPLGDWWEFVTAARYVRVTMGGNNGTCAVYVIAQSD